MSARPQRARITHPEEQQLDETLHLIAMMVEDCVSSHRFEEGRQKRIAEGQEHVCVVCGCSESRSCEEGCVWANETHCSRCIWTP
jgi:hypothetical protein